MKTVAYNPILPSYEYVPDGEPHVFQDRVYLYGSHDRFNGKNFCLNNYVAWSAPVDDLGNWRFEGQIYAKSQDPLNPKGKLPMFAPDVQKGRDGKFYLFYFLGFEGLISVAVCDQPAGKYRFHGHVKHPDGTLLGKAAGDPFMFDPGIFLDEDGRIFLYTGFAPKPVTRIFLAGRGALEGAYVTELEPDFLTVKQPPRLILNRKGKADGTPFEGHEFFEAASMRKFGSTYYFIYSSDQNHELCYATGETPVGPFRFGGTLVSNADIGFHGRAAKDALNYYGNNHGSLLEVDGKFYVFYHRQTNRHEYSRQACAERIERSSAGRFEQAEMTSCGLNGGPLPGKGTYPSHIACNLFSKRGTGSYSPLNLSQSFRKHPYLTQEGPDREERPDQYVANMRDGSVAGFKYFHFDDLRHVTVFVDGKGDGKIEVFSDLSDISLGMKSFDATPETVGIPIEVNVLNGIHPLYFRFSGKGFINLRSFRLD